MGMNQEAKRQTDYRSSSDERSLTQYSNRRVLGSAVQCGTCVCTVEESAEAGLLILFYNWN